MSPTEIPTNVPSVGKTKLTFQYALTMMNSLSHPHCSFVFRILMMITRIIAPTKEPTSSPSKIPTVTPTTKHPTASPTVTSSPSLLVFYGYELPRFEISITHENSVDSDLLHGAIVSLLDQAFKKEFTYYHNVEINLQRGEEEITTDGTVTKFTFGGMCKFTTDNAYNIPSENTLKDTIINAFLGNMNRVGILFKGATMNTYKYFSLQHLAQSGESPNTQVISGNEKGEVITEVDAENPARGSLTLTIAASGIAILSTLTALGLIMAQRRKMAGESENENSPTKAAEDRSPKGLGKIRSPFAMTSPVDGTRKYFNKLDDESVSLNRPKNSYLNPNISVVNSSFSRDEESSLEAPSMTGLSSICGVSKAENSLVSLDGMESAMDGESCADMSALDEVRLGRVLNLDESTVGENSRTTLSENGSKSARKNTFAKLWYGNRKRKEKSSPLASENLGSSVLAPPPKDSPTKKRHSPLRASPLASSRHSDDDPETDESVALSKNEGDENSLLGNQSDKGSYYDHNESRNLFSMLGNRSDMSESDDIDFNDMYGVDASSYDDYSSMGASSKLGDASSVIATVAGGHQDDETDC